MLDPLFCAQRSNEYFFQTKSAISTVEGKLGRAMRTLGAYAQEICIFSTSNMQFLPFFSVKLSYFYTFYEFLCKIYCK